MSSTATKALTKSPTSPLYDLLTLIRGDRYKRLKRAHKMKLLLQIVVGVALFAKGTAFVLLQFICYITVLPDVMDNNHAEISRRRGHFSH